MFNINIFQILSEQILYINIYIYIFKAIQKVSTIYKD